LCRVSHNGENFSDLAELRHYYAHNGVLIFFASSTTRCFPNAVEDSISQVLRASTHPWRTFPSNSFGSLRT
jgi:hypothetical protein